MNPRIERLKALVAQLIARLEHEQAENRRLSAQLAAREAELAQTRKRLTEMRSKAEAIVTSLSHGAGGDGDGGL